MAKTAVTRTDRVFTNSDKRLEFTIYGSDGVTPEDITGWSLSWLLKKRPTDADAAAIISKSTVSGIAITDGPNGLCTVTIQDDDTDGTVRAGTYWHELKRTDAGFETPLCENAFELLQSAHIS